MKKKVKQVIVFGLGRFGSSVAETLCQMNHEVLAIDSDKELVDAISPYVTQAVQADATDETVLDALGIGNFDMAVVAIGDIRDSILVTAICKENGVEYILAKAMDELHAKVLTKVGADKIVYPERDMGARVAHTMMQTNVIDLMMLNNEYALMEVNLPAAWEGKSIIDVDVRKKFALSILAIRRGSDYIVAPQPAQVMRAGDTLLVFGRDADIDAIEVSGK
ncbi:MAG: TrkA family potassium uptake protein [Eubacteriales bacterium]|nr:TrkA family potassium uptake protein [Eubacteriales bacterium]MDD3882067.1 TrkA family potassium uptake protein [Eubacteriales bacterium]MDD4512514.1 TrkA family potassium uptake protein [Eubacteriales bacterium]